jgi:mRNA-degrading endonuclease toxin of MazEF toxin-antitoxin module
MIAGKESHALLSQMRVIDTKRLVRKIAVLDTQMFEIIRKTARGLL